MFAKNGNFHQVGEVTLNAEDTKCSVEILTWYNEADYPQNPFNQKSLCKLEFETWDESTFSQIENMVLLNDNWLPYSKELARKLAEPDTTFAELKAGKSASVRNACGEAILAGFESDALGEVYLYPSNDKDQVNLSATVQKSLLTDALPTDYYLFLCMSLTNIWEYLPHTAAQIQKVGSDGYNHILSMRVRNAQLQGAIEACTTQAELDLIAW